MVRVRGGAPATYAGASVTANYCSWMSTGCCGTNRNRCPLTRRARAKGATRPDSDCSYFTNCTSRQLHTVHHLQSFQVIRAIRYPPKPLKRFEVGRHRGKFPMPAHAIEVALNSFIGYAPMKEPAAVASSEFGESRHSLNGRFAAFADFAPRRLDLDRRASPRHRHHAMLGVALVLTTSGVDYVRKGHYP
jgi:hypothetical protein